MDRKLDVVVFVPVFNEREKIGSVLERIRQVAGARIRCLIVADDGSTDGSDRIAAPFADHLVRLPANRGNGAVTRRALEFVREQCSPCDAVVRIDGDGQHDPELLPQVIDQIERGADLVICSRFSARSDTASAPLDRKCLNTAIAGMVRNVTGWPVTDARSGFLGFRWDKLAPIIDALKTEQYGIPIELLLRFWHANPKSRFAEIPHPARYEPGISTRLDQKYHSETTTAKVIRLDAAYRVFLTTCKDLRISA